MTFVLVIVLSIGVQRHPQPNELACNQAVASAQAVVARDYPGAVFIRAECVREGRG